jgi:hypothetical protein
MRIRFVTRAQLQVLWASKTEKHTIPDGTIPLYGLSPSAVSRQWGTIVLYSGTGKIILPISAKVYVIVLQHYGSTPQYNGVDITQNVSSSLKDQEEIRFIAITK